jgi:O-antigen ligase
MHACAKPPLFLLKRYLPSAFHAQRPMNNVFPNTTPAPNHALWRDRWPIVVALFGCIFLQRFGIPMGELKLPIVVPVVAAVFLVLLIQNRALVSEAPAIFYIFFCIYALFSAGLALAVPPQGTIASVFSLGYLLLLYSFIVLRVRPALGVIETLKIFRSFVTIIAICAVLQFAAQFAGIRLFSFAEFIPEALLLEPAYNVVIPIWYGSAVYKANGFFLLEPSFLSQFVAIALVIEFLYFGSAVRMGLLVLALLVAFSGTGFLILGFAVVVASVLERRALWRVAILLVVGGSVVALFGALIAPEYIDSMVRRTSELNSNEASGFIRFISPYMMVMDATADPRSILGFGPGTAERFESLGYEYGINALTKILIEYGIPGLAVYVLLLISCFYRADMRALSAVGFFWFIFGGGYHLTPAVVYTLAALFAWGPGPAPRLAAAPGHFSSAFPTRRQAQTSRPAWQDAVRR